MKEWMKLFSIRKKEVNPGLGHLYEFQIFSSAEQLLMDFENKKRNYKPAIVFAGVISTMYDNVQQIPMEKGWTLSLYLEFKHMSFKMITHEL